MLSGQNIIWRNLQKRGILHLITELCPAGAESNYFFSSCMKWQKLWNHLISWSCVCVKSTSLGSNTICSSGVKCKLYYTSSLWTFQNSLVVLILEFEDFLKERDLSNAMALALPRDMGVLQHYYRAICPWKMEWQFNKKDLSLEVCLLSRLPSPCLAAGCCYCVTFGVFATLKYLPESTRTESL